jgi:zinc transporter ZupT
MVGAASEGALSSDDVVAAVTPTSVFVLTLLMASMTGLGSVPFFLLPKGEKLSPLYAGLANAIACGVMLAASFDMVHEGQPHGPGLVVFGLFCGATFIAFLQKILRAHEDVSFANLVGADARKTLLVVGIMTAHSFGEGSGVGVSFSGVHGWAQGCLVTFAIGVHNVPEGLAVSTVLASKGVKPMQCLFWSVVSSLPQTVTAVPSFLFVETFTSLMPFGVGFSAGCMIWIVFAELLPDAFEGAEDARAVATAATMSAAALEGFRMAMQRLDNEDGTLRAPTLKDFGLGGDDVGSGGGGGKSTFYLALAPAFIASFALFTLRFTNKRGTLLVERLFRDKVRRNDEIDMNSNNNNIEGDVLKSSSARRKSSFADGKIGATLGIASGVLIVMGVRAMLLTLRAIYYGGVVEIVFAVVGVMLARFILLRLPKLVFLDAFSSNESAEKNSTTTNSSSSLASLANGWDAIDGAFEAFIVSITCVSLSVLDGVRFASASESLENIHIEFPACIRALVRTAPAALSAFSCKAGNASELALRASLSVGFAFFFSAVVAAKFVKVFKSERDLNKHLEESSGKKNLFKIEGLLEAASCLMCAYAFSRALWPRATRETRRGSNDEQAGLMLGLMLGVSANVALFALGSMTPYTDAL